jgi:leucyl aminopeptidase (aminopeptidase T)
MSENERFQRGITHAVDVCMAASKEDRVLVTTDQITEEIGRSLADRAEQIGAEVKLVYLEDYGDRPLTEVPEAMISDAVDFLPTVTFFAASGQPGEVKMRMGSTLLLRQELDRLEAEHPRRAHMIGITRRLILEGMNADYQQIHDRTMQVLERVKNARTIRVTSKKGSDLTATFNPEYRWVPCHGLYHEQGEGGNLPEGEVFTCPDTVDGVIVADVLGDYFSPKYGVLDQPVRFEIRNSLVEKISCQDSNLEEEIRAYLNSAEHGSRAGEFAIGTNTAVESLSGNLLQDEKIPGIHVAFGNPIGNETGADWTSDVHIDVIPSDCTIWVDDQLLLSHGTFHLDDH